MLRLSEIASGYQISVIKATWNFAQGVCSGRGRCVARSPLPLLQGSDTGRDGRGDSPIRSRMNAHWGPRFWFGGSIRSMFPSTSARPATDHPLFPEQNARHRACILHRSPRRLRAQTPQRQHGLTSEQQGRLKGFPHYVIGVMLDQLDACSRSKARTSNFTCGQ